MTDYGNPRRLSTALRLDDSGVLSWVHFGDLHMTQADQQNYRDLLALIVDANNQLGDGVNFAVLPGDNADDGTEDQYRLVQAAVGGLAIPLHVIPGDHDIKTGSLDLFRRYLEPEPVQSFAAGLTSVFSSIPSMPAAERGSASADINSPGCVSSWRPPPERAGVPSSSCIPTRANSATARPRSEDWCASIAC